MAKTYMEEKERQEISVRTDCVSMKYEESNYRVPEL